VVSNAPKICIQELVRRIRLRRLEGPSVGAAVLIALAACNAGQVVREVPRAIPPQVIASKRSDDIAPLLPSDGPEFKTPQLAPRMPGTEPMPPGRGMTYAMEQPDPYWDSHAAIQSSMQQFRNAALLDAAYRGGLKTKTPPGGGAPEA
jgi:hypothetical protein